MSDCVGLESRVGLKSEREVVNWVSLMERRENEVREESRNKMGTVGSPATRRGKTSREHSVHFPDSLVTEQEEAEVDTVDMGRKEESASDTGEKEEKEELERVRSQMQHRDRRDSLELVKEVPPCFSLKMTSTKFQPCFFSGEASEIVLPCSLVQTQQ